MIIKEKVKDLEIVGDHDSKKAKISVDKMKKLQYLLTKGLYKDPITAVVAEWANNGVDSVIQAGKNPVESPVIVSITKNDKGQFILSIEDKGTGLDDQDFENICMNYLESTKEGDNDTIGHFGIGMKSFLSLERSATFTCRKDGVERKYLVYEGDEFVNFDLIHHRTTTEENGVIAELCIKDWSEKQLFIEKAKAKLAYYDTVVLVIDGNIVKNDIYRNKVFQYSTLNKNQYIHIALKDVYYTIDYEALGIAPVYLPVAIRLELGDGLTPTPSRESYITNDKVRELLLRKIKDVAEWFVNRYNKTITEFPDLVSAYTYLGNNEFHVPLEGKTFHINPILGHSKVKVLEPKVKGLQLKDGLWYKSRSSHLIQSYTACGYTFADGTSTCKEHRIAKDNEIFIRGKKPILVGADYVGNVKTYLNKKYGPNQIFLRKNSFEMKLGGEAHNKKYIDRGESYPDTYYNILNLKNEKKKNWRALIKEWQFVVSTITSTFRDETKIASSQEYADWLDKKKAHQKAVRAAGYISGTYTGLNKQLGDVTMAFSYERYGKIHFKKETFPIKDLPNNKFLTVVIDPNEQEKAKSMAAANKLEHIKFAVVGKLERKKLPNTKQFVTFKQYLSMSSKPFIRLASAILFKRVVDDYEAMARYKGGVFKMLARQLVKDVELLNSYQKKYLVSCKKEVESAILQVAEEHKLFDMKYWDVYERVRKDLKKYDFISLFKEPDHWDKEQTERYQTIVNQLLLFRKKNYNDLEGAQIVFKNGKIEN